MKIHMVKSGDSMYTIAQKYNVGLEQLIAFNPQISDPNVIDVGMKVKIPKNVQPDHGNVDYAHKHTVVQGDSLWKISKYWGISLKAMIDANPQLKNPNVLLTGETVYIPNTTPTIHQAMSINPANMAAPAPLNMANDNIQAMPNIQFPMVELQPAPPFIVEQQAMPKQAPLEEKQPAQIAPEEMQKPAQIAPEEMYKPAQIAPEEMYMPTQIAPQEMYKPAQIAPQEMYKPAQIAPEDMYKPMQFAPQQQQQMAPQYALPISEVMPGPSPFLQQDHIPEQKTDGYNVYSSEHLFAQFNIPAVEAQAKADHSYAMQLPTWEYGDIPQYAPMQPYSTEMPGTSSFAPVYGSPKPNCGCGCGGPKQYENAMYNTNPQLTPQMQSDYYQPMMPYYGPQQMQPGPQSSAQPMQMPMQEFFQQPNLMPMQESYQQPNLMPMQQYMQPNQWDLAAASNLGYPLGANYGFTMPYAFAPTYPAPYMMPCYPMNNEMGYLPAMQLPYTMPYPTANMPHQNSETGRINMADNEISQNMQETQEQTEVKPSRKSKKRTEQPAVNDRAVLHEFLQNRRVTESNKEAKFAQPWINY